MQYLESPFKILEELFIYSPEFIIIDRTAFIDRERDRLTIHKIPEKIYPNSLPCWFFSKKSFFKKMNLNGYNLEEEFECNESSDIGIYKGLLFKKDLNSKSII